MPRAFPRPKVLPIAAFAVALVLTLAAHPSRPAAQMRAPLFSSIEAAIAAFPRPLVFPGPLAAGRPYRLHRWSLPLDRVELDLKYARGAHPVERTLRRERALLVVNAGFFDRMGAPMGLTHVKGETITPFSEHLEGGVLTVAHGVARLHDTAGFRPPSDMAFALQSKPRLVVGSRVNIQRNDGHRADRTALCIRDGGRILDVYVARSDHWDGRDGPTLYALARILQSHGCEEALNLDGGPSTSAAWRDGESVRVLRPRDPIRQVIVVRGT